MVDLRWNKGSRRAGPPPRRFALTVFLRDAIAMRLNALTAALLAAMLVGGAAAPPASVPASSRAFLAVARSVLRGERLDVTDYQ